MINSVKKKHLGQHFRPPQLYVRFKTYDIHMNQYIGTCSFSVMPHESKDIIGPIHMTTDPMGSSS